MDGLRSGITNADIESFVRRHPRGSNEFLHAALRGLLPGVRRVVFGGSNSDVDTATAPEDIFGGNGLIPRPVADESWELVSSSANDNANGTGARSVTLTTLYSDYLERTQTVVPNGLTAVPLIGVNRFINTGRLLTAGSKGNPDGILTIRVAGGGEDRGYIDSTSLLNQAKYTVPAGYTLDMHSALFAVRSSGGTESCVVTITLTNSDGLVISAIKFPLFVSGGNLYRHELAGGRVPFNTVQQRTQVQIQCLVVTQNNTQVDASVVGLLYQNSLWQ